IIFGSSGSTYLVQFDHTIFMKSYLMLFGPRNGLFIFWSILIFSVFGYFLKIAKNPTLYHVLFIILLIETLLFGSTVFWSGDLGFSFGQRRFLVAFPCLVLFLARFIEICRKRYFWFLPVFIVSVIWANLVYAAYGIRWYFPDGVTGFLYPIHLAGMFAVIEECYPMLVQPVLELLFIPKHTDIWWLFPLFSIVVTAIWLIFRRFEEQRRFTFCLVSIVISAVVTTAFLSSAAKHGEQVFRNIVANNPQVLFKVRNYEIDYEIVGSAVDMVSFFLEEGDPVTAQRHYDKISLFLAKEGPDQAQNFKEMCDGLLLRKSMGWERLVPERNHAKLLNWYRVAKIDIKNNRTPLNVSEEYLY
ncbi:MAG: hypothetical protein PHU01_02195, partial [Desulfuromonadaceae bacterium]|nr:hypothetical protein [Desulfuromonadaceae bacterium]